MIIAVDFDDTLVEKLPFPQINYTLKKDAKEVITSLASKGVIFVLHTARYGWWRLPAIYYIKKQKLPIKIKYINRKIRADLYIDDKNYPKQEINWKKIEKYVEGLINEKN